MNLLLFIPPPADFLFAADDSDEDFDSKLPLHSQTLLFEIELFS